MSPRPICKNFLLNAFPAIAPTPYGAAINPSDRGSHMSTSMPLSTPPNLAATSGRARVDLKKPAAPPAEASRAYVGETVTTRLA